ncbi:PAS domain-containing protein [Caulobacter sp. UNC358MFTsu5.1]|uniref:motility/cell cycle regulatory protein MopJ n=1 Tax=Caulobacter sp. UNC358MFTsu5.1 TaxID=1449049 RepID=UPI0012DD374C|nr:PAS domain-containing protein [Caulobacter sp. UNC358MFTsu5.1]
MKMNAQLSASATAARAHQEMFAYWASLRRGASLPSRLDLHPSGIKRMLPTVSLIDVKRDPNGAGDGAIDYRLRLAGTGLYSVYGREITGRTLEDVYNTAAVEYWRRELDKVVTERRPGVGVHSLAWKGSPHMSILWLRLPLARNGKDVDMILGYDAVVGSQVGDQQSGIRAA